MSYAEIMLESSVSPILLEQVIADAVHDACINGGEEVFEAFSMYLKILESNGEYEPKEEFEQQLDEVFTPFFENAASIYGGMLLTEDAFGDAWKGAPTKAARQAEQKSKMDANNKKKGFVKRNLQSLRVKGKLLARGIKRGLSSAKKSITNSSVGKAVAGGSNWVKTKLQNKKSYGKFNPSNKFSVA